ncbi:MAG: PAS domain S-box-containing protein [Kiritimatiellia bacterium]|jgi:PAS domain S-box-containing protein
MKGSVGAGLMLLTRDGRGDEKGGPFGGVPSMSHSDDNSAPLGVDQRLQTLVANLPFCVHEIDLQGRITSMNSGGLKMFGLEDEAQIVGVDYLNAVCAHDRDRIGVLLAQALEGQSSQFEFEAVSVERKAPIYSSCFIPLKDATGEPYQIMGYTQDVTERRERERALSQRLERMAEERAALLYITKLDGFGDDGFMVAARAIIEAASPVLQVERLSLWRLDEAGSRLECVDLFDRNEGVHTAGAVLEAVHYPSYFRALNTGAVLDAHDAKRDPRTSEFDESYLTPFGITSMLDCPLSVPDYFDGVLCAEHVGERRHWDFDEVQFLGAVAAHVSRVMYDARQVELQNEHVYLERQILHAQKLESLGILAGGIAHDFNNILTTVLGNADLALLKLPEDSPARNNIAEIEKGARLAADLATQMLAYSGKGKFVTKKISVNEFLMDMIHLLEVSISKASVIKLHLADGLPTITVDPTQFRQVVMNLVTNASDAIGFRGGTISLSTGVMYCDAACLKDSKLVSRPADEPGAEKSRYLYLEVADTGHGMDEETIAKIFDPFFTTKFSGRGLGLAATLGIMRGHKGAVKIYSEVGKGTTFKVLFPADEDREATEGVQNRQVESKKSSPFGGLVLVVDDMETVRCLARSMLERLGFDVITAPDGREAVQLYREYQDSIRLVLLDVTMSDMGGKEAFRELRAINKDVCVVLCSGYSEDDIEQQFIGKGLAGFLQKPFSTADLTSVLMSAFSSESGTLPLT